MILIGLATAAIILAIFSSLTDNCRSRMVQLYGKDLLNPP